MAANWEEAGLLDTVKDMWLSGDSAAYIASQLGRGITKNAIIGKVTRLGLQRRKKVSYGRDATLAPPEKHRRYAKAETLPGRKMGYGQLSNTKKRSKAALIEANEAQFQQRDVQMRQKLAKAEHVAAIETALRTAIVVPIDERRGVQAKTKDQCNWPFGHPGDADFHYCHLQHEPGLPYCSVHLHHAYTQLPKTAFRL